VDFIVGVINVAGLEENLADVVLPGPAVVGRLDREQVVVVGYFDCQVEEPIVPQETRGGRLRRRPVRSGDGEFGDLLGAVPGGLGDVAVEGDLVEGTMARERPSPSS